MAPLGDETRLQAHCPAWGCAKTAMHQPHHRLRYEAGFLPRALREQHIDLYISTFNMEATCAGLQANAPGYPPAPLLFGALALLLSPAKAFLAVIGLAGAVTILRFPFWGPPPPVYRR